MHCTIDQTHTERTGVLPGTMTPCSRHVSCGLRALLPGGGSASTTSTSEETSATQAHVAQTRFRIATSMSYKLQQVQPQCPNLRKVRRTRCSLMQIPLMLSQVALTRGFSDMP